MCEKKRRAKGDMLGGVLASESFQSPSTSPHLRRGNALLWSRVLGSSKSNTTPRTTCTRETSLLFFDRLASGWTVVKMGMRGWNIGGQDFSYLGYRSPSFETWCLHQTGELLFDEDRECGYLETKYGFCMHTILYRC